MNIQRPLARSFTWFAALALIVAGCGGSALDEEQTATDIGAELALRLAEPILRASTAESGTETAQALRTLEESMSDSVRELSMPEGVADVVAGSNSGFAAANGYASASIALTVIPEDEQPLFCMAFAIGSDGTVIAEPAPGDPVNRCADTDLVNPLQP